MKHIFSCIGGAVLSAALLAAPASAATITYSGVADDMLYNGASDAFTWRQFDPLAGVLNAVTYEVSGAFDLSISHTAPFAIYPTYNVSKGFTLNGTGLVFKPSGSAPFDGMINAGWNSQGLLQPGVTQTQTIALDFLRVPDFGLTPFIGTGMINTILGLSEDSDQCFSYDLYSTSYTVDCTQKGNLTVSVTYDYTPTSPTHDAPVPEPAAFWLLGLGVTGAAFFARQRGGYRRQSASPLT